MCGEFYWEGHWFVSCFGIKRNNVDLFWFKIYICFPRTNPSHIQTFALFAHFAVMQISCQFSQESLYHKMCVAIQLSPPHLNDRDSKTKHIRCAYIYIYIQFALDAESWLCQPFGTHSATACVTTSVVHSPNDERSHLHIAQMCLLPHIVCAGRVKCLFCWSAAHSFIYYRRANPPGWPKWIHTHALFKRHMRAQSVPNRRQTRKKNKKQKLSHLFPQSVRWKRVCECYFAYHITLAHFAHIDGTHSEASRIDNHTHIHTTTWILNIYSFVQMI